MVKNTKANIIALVILFVGWFFIGIGYGEAVVAPFNSILFYGGMVLFFVGLIGSIYLFFK